MARTLVIKRDKTGKAIIATVYEGTQVVVSEWQGGDDVMSLLGHMLFGNLDSFGIDEMRIDGDLYLEMEM